MCLIFLSLQDHPTYKLIIAANRDEFYHRKTADADFWKDHPDILAGRDLEAGGTWMGASRSGRIALLTNYRDPMHINPNAPSRGHLVSHYLEGTTKPDDYLRNVRANEYNGFNLLVGSTNEMWYLSNYGKGILKLEAGLHGLSNHLMDTPWPKVRSGKEKLRLILSNTVIRSEELFEFLYDDHVAPDDQLPDTGVGLERERALSSMFIKSPGYGSRCSTVILVDRHDHLQFSERVYDLQTFHYTTKNFEFDVV